MSFHNSNSQKIFDLSTPNSPTDTFLFKTNFQKIKNIKKIYSFRNNKSQTINCISLKKNPFSIKQIRKNYDNPSIFGRREKAYHKSIEDKRKVFKYQDYYFNEKNIIEFNGNKTSKSLYKEGSSFYLTEKMVKSNSTFLPNISNKEKIVVKNKSQKNIFVDKNLLNKITHKKNLEKNYINPEEKFCAKSINKKEMLLNRNCDKKSFKNFIFKLKNFINEKYGVEIKRERYNIMKENTNDKYEFLNTKKKLLEKNFNQYSHSFMGNFTTKFNEYIRHIFFQCEQDKLKNNFLKSEIQKLKKIESALEMKIIKIQNDRDALNRWMFLQICLKEKVKKVPDYYKFIINNDFDLKYGINGNLEINGKYSISSEEVNRILNYKKNLIYKDGESFLNEIKKYENENIDLIKRYNLISEEIMLLKQEKETLLNDEQLSNSNELTNINLDKIISLKNKILESVKKKNSKLIQDKMFLTINNKEKKNNLHHSKLYIKMKKYCDNLSKLLFYEFKDNISSKLLLDISEEQLILIYLKRFEKMIYHFMKKNIIMKEIYGEAFTNEEIKHEKEKKIRKNFEQKLNIKMVLENERKKLFEKTNKVLFLPLHKINAYNITGKKLMLRKYKQLRGKQKESIDDYLIDSDDD